MENARQFVSVLAVLLGLLCTVWFLRKHPGKLPAFWPRRDRGAGFRVLSRVVLTPQHSLHLVELGEERLVLAAGPQGVEVLRALGDGAKPAGLPGRAIE